MTDALVSVLLVLAAYRVWRLLAVDDVTEPIRRRLFTAGSPKYPWAWEFFACPWCFGSWLAFAAVAGVWAVRPLPLPALWFGAVATGVGIVAEVLERLEPGDW